MKTNQRPLTGSYGKAGATSTSATDYQPVVRQLHQLTRIASLHLPNNEAVSLTIRRTEQTLSPYKAGGIESLAFLFAGTAVFVNGRLLRASHEVYELGLALGQKLERIGYNQFTLPTDVSETELRGFTAALLGSWTPATHQGEKRSQIGRIVVRAINVAALDLLGGADDDAKQKISRVYAAVLIAMRQAWANAYASQPIPLTYLKRLVHQLVRLSKEHPHLFIALARMRNLHEEPAGVAVKTAMLAIQALSFGVSDLNAIVRIGMSALFMDLGRPRAAGVLHESFKVSPGDVPELNALQRFTLADQSAIVGILAGGLDSENLERTAVVVESHQLDHLPDSQISGLEGTWTEMEPYLLLVSKRYAEAMKFDVRRQTTSTPEETAEALVESARNDKELIATEFLLRSLRIRVNIRPRSGAHRAREDRLERAALASPAPSSLNAASGVHPPPVPPGGQVAPGVQLAPQAWPSSAGLPFAPATVMRSSEADEATSNHTQGTTGLPTGSAVAPASGQEGDSMRSLPYRQPAFFEDQQPGGQSGDHFKRARVDMNAAYAGQPRIGELWDDSAGSDLWLLDGTAQRDPSAAEASAVALPVGIVFLPPLQPSPPSDAVAGPAIPRSPSRSESTSDVHLASSGSTIAQQSAVPSAGSGGESISPPGSREPLGSDLNGSRAKAQDWEAFEAAIDTISGAEDSGLSMVTRGNNASGGNQSEHPMSWVDWDSAAPLPVSRPGAPDSTSLTAMAHASATGRVPRAPGETPGSANPVAQHSAGWAASAASQLGKPPVGGGPGPHVEQTRVDEQTLRRMRMATFAAKSGPVDPLQQRATVVAAANAPTRVLRDGEHAQQAQTVVFAPSMTALRLPADIDPDRVKSVENFTPSAGVSSSALTPPERSGAARSSSAVDSAAPEMVTRISQQQVDAASKVDPGGAAVPLADRADGILEDRRSRLRQLAQRLDKQAPSSSVGQGAEAPTRVMVSPFQDEPPDGDV